MHRVQSRVHSTINTLYCRALPDGHQLQPGQLRPPSVGMFLGSNDFNPPNADSEPSLHIGPKPPRLRAASSWQPVRRATDTVYKWFQICPGNVLPHTIPISH
jgi:hypothetical protein